jgi:hypothetical protein
MGKAHSTHEGRDLYIGYRLEYQKEKRPLGRSRHRWEDNIKIDLREIGWGIDWIVLAQDTDQRMAVMNMAMNFLIP